MSGRVFVFGIDGVPLWFIEDARDKGYIKNIPRLMDNGVYGRLVAVPPIYTPPNWTSAFTGVDPGEHGISGFTRFTDEYTITYTTSRHRRADPVWIIAGRYGRKSIVVNVPVTYPPDEFNGVMISGDERFGPPPRNYVYPPEVYNILREMNYRIASPPYGSIGEVVSNMCRDIAIRSRVTQRLMKSYEWDLTIVVYRELDHIMHAFLGIDKLGLGARANSKKFSLIPYEVLSVLDEELARFMEYLDDGDHIIIMSDHGMEPKRKIFYPNHLLIREGFIRLKKRRVKRRKFIKLSSLRRSSILRSLWYLLSPRLRVFIKNKILLRIAREDRLMNLGLVDWSGTKAYFYSNFGELVINLKGREREGVVDIEDYDRVVDEIIELFRRENERRVRDGEEPIFRDIVPVRRIYRSVDGDFKPDIIMISSSDVFCRADILDDTDVLEKPIYTSMGIDDEYKHDELIAQHSPDGFYLFYGPAFPPRGNGGDLVMMDIAPLILYLLNIPIPNYFHGRLCIENLGREWLERNPPRMYRSIRFSIRERIRGIRKQL